MNLGKYIHELLLKNETVIIPGFGAFTSIYKPSETDEEKEVLKPPSKIIGFDPQIRNNDGLLVGKVAEEEEISHFDALKRIEKERENILHYLDKIGRKTLEGTGELFYDENREINFTPVLDENLLLESYGLEPISLNEFSEKTKEAETQDEEPKTEEEPDPELVKAVADLLKNTDSGKPDFYIPKTSNKTEEINAEDEIITEEEFENESIYSLSEEYEKKKKRRWLWLLLVLIPVIVAVVYFSMIKKSDDEFVDPYKELEESITVDTEELPVKQEPDPVIKDTAVISKEDMVIQPEVKPETESKQEDQVVATDIPKYYLVSGSFKEETNAQEYFDQLKNEGLEPIHMGKNGSFYIIGLGIYDTSKEALEAKRQFENRNSKSGLWILKK